MINLDEKNLKLLLNDHKHLLENKKINGIDTIISTFSLGITLILGDFNNIKFIPSVYFKSIAWIIVIIFFIYGCYNFMKSLKYNYTIETLYNEILKLEVKHIFNVVLLKNNHKDGKYLLYNNTRWKCNFFPNYNAIIDENGYNEELNLKSVRTNLSINTGVLESDIQIKYLGYEESEKYSHGDKINKKYQFHFYRITANLSEHQCSFNYNGTEFCWMTLGQMYEDKNILSKNQDMLDFVRKIDNIS